MSQTVGDYFLDRLSTWEVRRVYGYPGDGINGLMGAFERADEGTIPDFVQVRHEEMAAFMACAHASSPASWACAWPHRVPGRSTCSMGDYPREPLHGGCRR